MAAWLAAAIALAALDPAAGSAAGAEFPPAGCAFDHWPQAGWRVAPRVPAENGRSLLRASHEPRRGLALEAWVEAGARAEEVERAGAQIEAMRARGWNVFRSDRAMVGGFPAIRARAHRGAGGELYLMEEYWIDAAGQRYVLRVTSRGARGLQSPDVRRWLGSFRLIGKSDAAG